MKFENIFYDSLERNGEQDRKKLENILIIKLEIVFNYCAMRLRWKKIQLQILFAREEISFRVHIEMRRKKLSSTANT